MHAIDGLGLGGAERVLVDLANATVRDGHRVTVCVTRNDLTRRPELDPRVELLVLGRTRSISPTAIARLRRYLHAENVDVIHAHMRSTAAHMLLLRGARVVSIPVIVHDHYGSIETDKSVPLWFRLGHRFASYYVGVSDQLRDWARAVGMPRERSTTISNPIDLTRFEHASAAPVREEMNIPAAASIGIVVATLRPDKGIDLLIEALAALRDPNVCVLLVGADGDPTYAQRCRDLTRDHALEGTVRFLGGRIDVPALLKAADFGVLPSRSESGPLVLVEYLASGLPIVATRVGDIGRKLADAGVPGFVAPGDAGALEAGLRALLALTRAERAARAEGGRAAVTQGWEVRNSMSRWYEVYRVALVGGSA
jgi:glycosyltransferase involved in cell wall biosynthesis